MEVEEFSKNISDGINTIVITDATNINNNYTNIVSNTERIAKNTISINNLAGWEILGYLNSANTYTNINTPIDRT